MFYNGGTKITNPLIYNSIILHIFAAVSIIIWIILIIFRGGFWLANQRLATVRGKIDNPPEVVVIIPARNEEMTIGESLSSLLKQNYEGKFSIIVVNDNSEDGTLKAAKIAGAKRKNLIVINGKELPAGWTGKMWAVEQGIVAAKFKFPRALYYLLTDADIMHHPENLAALIAKAQIENLALVSLMVKLRCISISEHILIPAFIFFFQKLYPFPWVNNPNSEYAGAAGGCMLVNKNALLKAGGIEAIKGKIIDDCALAKLLKKTNPIWLGLTHSTTSLRSYDKLADIWHMVCRTAFVQLKYSTLKLTVTILAMLIIYFIPVSSILIGLLSKDIALLVMGLIAWVMMLITYKPTLSLYNRPTWEACLLPISALLFSAMTLDSARKYWIDKTPSWKGRQNIK